MSECLSISMNNDSKEEVETLEEVSTSTSMREVLPFIMEPNYKLRQISMFGVYLPHMI